MTITAEEIAGEGDRTDVLKGDSDTRLIDLLALSL